MPLVADMTSNFLSRPIDVDRFGLIYASAQKNIGPSGLTVVVLRADLIGGAHPFPPSVFDYEVQAKNESMYNTPATLSIYVAGLVSEWIKDRGGLDAMDRASRRKSGKLYEFIDSNDLTHCPVLAPARSRVNVRFEPAETALADRFLGEAGDAGLVNLKGHKAVGGFRASLYNAMPEEGGGHAPRLHEGFRPAARMTGPYTGPGHRMRRRGSALRDAKLRGTTTGGLA